MKKLAQSGLIFLMLSVSACQSAPDANAESGSTAELQNTLWKLTELNGASVSTADGQRMASLTLDSQASQARIVTACNRGSAGFTLEGDSIKFAAAISTKMMCPPEQMQQEAAFLKVIADTVRYEIKGETLELYNSDKQLLAAFHSEYLK